VPVLPSNTDGIQAGGKADAKSRAATKERHVLPPACGVLPTWNVPYAVLGRTLVNVVQLLSVPASSGAAVDGPS
jgi:hypothetical protein